MEFQQFNKEEYLKLPDKPGIYKFINKLNQIIYVGKAKNLKKRVSSYFTKNQLDNRKTYHLIGEISKIEFILVSSEFDALLLENNLIKEFQPKFNILLKDDKSFPSICITNERFPRIYSTRRIDRSKGEYFGPYTSVKTMNAVLDLIRKLYKIRTCKFNLSEENIAKGKYKICLEYHIGNCLGPCEGHQTEESYLEDVSSVAQILRGRIGIVKRNFIKKMNEASLNLNFEIAENLKEKLAFLENFQSRSLIVNQKITNTDVFSIITEGKKSAFVNYMKVENGSIVNSETVEVKMRIDESKEEVFRFIIFDIRKKYKSTNNEILTNEPIEAWEGITVIQPKIGDKKKLIELSLKNSLVHKKEKYDKQQSVIPNETILINLQNDLKLKNLPVHIECFDNSNIQGSNPVAAMVCFKYAKPSKSDYRKFNIKTVVGPDDFSSMKEVVKRRYKHLQEAKKSPPQLVIIDGGKGQLNAAVIALKELSLYGKIPIIGIAKRLEEIYYPEDSMPLHISKRSTSLKLIQRLRDEAHRFAITFHKNKRSRNALQSSLDILGGIGSKTRNSLIKEFGSISRIKQASKRDLELLIGKSKTQIILEAINNGAI